MRYVCVNQLESSDCAPACLATILKYYGITISISKLRELSGTDKRGTNILGIVSAAKKLGFAAKAVALDQEIFDMRIPLPAIIHINNEEVCSHFIVLYAVKEKYVIVADPDKGIRRIDKAVFLKQWSGNAVLLAPTEKVFGNKSDSGLIAKFLLLIKPQKKLLLCIFFLSLVVSGLGIASSFYYSILMDDIIPNYLEDTLFIVSFGVLIIYIADVMMNLCRGFLVLALEKRIDIPLLLGYYQHMIELPIGFFETRKIGDIVSRFTDASRIRQLISNASITFMLDAFMFIIGGILLFVQNRKLFVVTIIIAGLYAIVVCAFMKPLKENNRKQFEHFSDLNAYIVETLNGIELVKANAAESEVKSRLESLYMDNLKATQIVSKIHIIQNTILTLVESVGRLLILWLGSIYILRGTMTAGALISFNVLVGYFLNPIKNLANLQSEMQGAIVAAERILDVFDIEVEKNEMEKGKVRLGDVLYPITFDNVKFRYGTKRTVLNGLSFTISKGEKVAFVGESGSGKTTLSKLLLSFYEYEAGNIYFGEYNLSDINKESLRDKIAYVSQCTHLFSTSVKDNLLFGNKNHVSTKRIIDVCKSVGADDFISDLPQKYDTLLVENGGDLSGGQKQRLAIARALLRNPDLLILDEATSNLDSISESYVQDIIKSDCIDVTTVVIAHRLSTIMDCDCIYVLDKGRIIEEGTHDSLLKKKGKYYTLWMNQTHNEAGCYNEIKENKAV